MSKFKGELKEEKSKVGGSCSGTTKEDIVNAIKEFDSSVLERLAWDYYQGGWVGINLGSKIGYPSWKIPKTI